MKKQDTLSHFKAGQLVIPCAGPILQHLSIYTQFFHRRESEISSVFGN